MHLYEYETRLEDCFFVAIVGENLNQQSAGVISLFFEFKQLQFDRCGNSHSSNTLELKTGIF